MNRKILLLLLILVSVCAISDVSASDLNATDEVSADDCGDEMLSDDLEANQLDSKSTRTFSDLQKLINKYGDMDDVYLKYDYAYNSEKDGQELLSGISFEECSYYFDEEITELSLTIYGNGHTIYGNGARIFNVGSFDTIYINDLNIVNDGSKLFNDGGAIYNDGYLYLNNCTISNNYVGSNGGAVYNDGYAEITNCSFDNNKANQDGGAIYNPQGHYLKVVNCTFEQNSAGTGGAIATYYYLSVYNSTFIGNEVWGDGGAVYNSDDEKNRAACNVIASDFRKNKAGSSGGAIYNAIATNCKFSNNKAGTDGANMYRGILIGSYNDKNDKLEETIISKGLSIEAKKGKAVDNGDDYDLTFGVVVTNNNEPVPGVMVEMLLHSWNVFEEDYSWDETYEGITDKNGAVSFEIKDMDYEYHPPLSIYLADYVYNKASIDSVLDEFIQIDKSKVSFGKDIVFTYGDSDYTNFTLVGASGVKAKVTGHPEANINIANRAIFVSSLEPGKYVLSVETIPDKFYTSESAVVNITVRKIPKIDFSAGIVFDYASSGTVHMIVEGGIVESKNIEVVGHPEAKTQLANDEITISGLNPGKYTLRVVSTPEEGLEHATGTVGITVKKATAVIKATKTTVALKKGTLWTIKLVDSKTGKPIKNMKITLKVYTGKKSKIKHLTTNSNGEAKYQTKGLAAGNHKIVVSASHVGYTFNTLTSSIKVIKPKALTFKVQQVTSDKKGSLVSFIVMDKKTKKGLNGVKVHLFIYTGKKCITIDLKTKKEGKLNGAVGYSTNKLSVGTHKVVIAPVEIKYSGSKTTSMKIKKSAKNYLPWENKISAK